MFRQTMKRQYGLVGDKTVVEEREVVLTERRYIWGSKMENVVEIKNGEVGEDVKEAVDGDVEMKVE